MIRRALVVSGLALTVAASARAEPAAQLPPAEQQSLDAFASAHAACQAWSDGCVICRRTKENSYGCSTPGIACQPAALACQEPKPQPAEAPH